MPAWWMSIPGRRVRFAPMVVGLLGVVTTGALGAPPMHTDAPALGVWRGKAAPDAPPGASRWRGAALDTRLLSPADGAERLTLDLFDDVSVTLERTSTRDDGRWTVWTGADKHGATGAFAAHDADGTLTGYVVAPGRGTFRVRSVRGVRGGVVVYQVDPERAGGCEIHGDHDAHAAGKTDARVHAENTAAEPAVGAAASGPALRGPSLTIGCDDGSVIDVLVAYTDVARAAAGGTTAIEGEGVLAIEAANVAYANSNIGTRLRLMGLHETVYSESGSFSTHIDRMQDPADGFMDDLPPMRDLLGADVVVLLVDDRTAGEPAGRAPLLPALNSSLDQVGFSVNRWDVAAPFTVPHEIGHNLGCAHEVGSGSGIFPYSNAYFVPLPGGPPARTVMAAVFNNSSIQYFSNPNVSYLGLPTGVAGSTDNALTINTTASTVANFRCSLGRCTDLYAIDNGANSGGIGVGSGDLIWFNRFTAQAGAERLFAIRVGWGETGVDRPTTLAIWSDPNQDGNPSDAQLVATFGPVGALPQSDLVVQIPLTDVGPAGTMFFVGARVEQQGSEFPAGIDSSTTEGARSWLSVGSNLANMNANGLPPSTLASFGSTNAWRIRAFGVAPSFDDCDMNGVPDDCDIALDASLDVNGNGTLDVCEPANDCPADWNNDGFLNDQDFFDWSNDFFTQSGPQGQSDFNEDGFQNDQDWFDFANGFFSPGPGCP